LWVGNCNRNFIERRRCSRNPHFPVERSRDGE
jgi:hypothetical protein